MRWLFETNDYEIRRQQNNFNRRLARRKKKIGPLTTKFRSEEPGKSKLVDGTLRQIRITDLLPPRKLVGLVPGRFRYLRIRAIVHLTGNRSDLEAMGIQVRSRAQDIFTIIGTKKQLAGLVNRPSCRSLRSPEMLFPDVEEADGQAEIDVIHAPRAVNPSGFRGNGVLVGIIDSPLDVTHHGFRDPAVGGTHGSRVLYYWAQSTHTECYGANY